MLEVRPMKREKTLFDWFRQHENGEIHMDPSYGRNSPERSEAWKALVVNSVLNGWDLPKFYLADFTFGALDLSEEKRWYGVIDGRRRLEAIFGFLRGEFPLGDTLVRASGLRYAGAEADLVIPGETMTDLRLRRPGLAVRFENHVPTVMSVISDSRADVEELMRRLEGPPRQAAEAAAAEADHAIGKAGSVTTDVRDNEFGP